MKVVGFNFDKISCEKLSSNYENLKINTNIDISSIEEVDPSLLLNKSEKILNIKFVYLLKYSENVAKIEFKGNVLLTSDEKKSKEILKKWDKKELDEDFKIPLFNMIFKKSNIKALELEDEMNLPYHIQLPSLKKKE